MTQYTEHCSSTIAASAVELDRGIRQIVIRWIARQHLKAALRRERRQLASMPEHLLRDIGINRESADAEARRRDIPRNRLP